MLSDKKENIQCYQQQSTKRSTSANKKILQNIIGTTGNTQRKSMDISMCSQFQNTIYNVGRQVYGKSTDRPTQNQQIKCLKLEEDIHFLTKKIQRQNQQILGITEELNQVHHKNNQITLLLNTQRQKNRKSQANLAASNKTISDLKKKLISFESVNKNFNTKNQEYQKKLFKLKELLRRKELSLSQMQQKFNINTDLQNIITKLKQETRSLRENFIILKAKQDKIETQNEKLSKIVEKSREEVKQLKTQLSISEEHEKRLENQYNEIQKLYNQLRNQSFEMEEQLKLIVQNKQIQLSILRGKTQRILQLQQSSKDTSVYREEISRILKKMIIDQHLRKKIEKEIVEVVGELENAWHNILIKALASQIYTR